MSSTSPLSARLAQIFSPRPCVLVASIFFAVGGVITSQAPSLRYFLFGRAIQGLGGAGIMTISFILVLELSGKKRRGLYIGLVNAGFTFGVSFGAVIAGALLPVMGWVSMRISEAFTRANNFSEILVLDSKSSCFDFWYWNIL